MEGSKYPMEGGCRCGEVRFKITAPPLLTMACHCRGCQQMTAAPYSATLNMAPDAFSLLQGEPVIGGLHGVVRHYFCPKCMSWVFTRLPNAENVLVKTTMLDSPGPASFPPFVESNILEKLPWATTPAVHSFEKFPPPESFKGLIEEYAQHAKGAK